VWARLFDDENTMNRALDLELRGLAQTSLLEGRTSYRDV
jgi:hypothetical protein